MMTFWIVTGVMVLGCIAWLLPTVLSPLRVSEDAGPSHDEHALASYTERLDAVEQEHADGALSDAQLEEARRELARELLQDTRPESARGGLNVAVGSWVGSAVVLLAVPALAIVTYMSLGSLHSLGFTGAVAATSTPAAAPGTAAASAGGGTSEGMPSIEEMVSGLAQRLKDNPDDAQGWLMLGRSYMVLDRLEDAQAAYAKAYALDAGRADILTGYAEALARNNNNSLAGRPQELLQSALALSPTDAKTLWLSGISAMQRGDRAAAIVHWEALKATEALNAEETASLDRMIAEARGEAPATRPRPAAPATVKPTQSAAPQVAQSATAPSGVSVSVTVSVAPDVAQSVRPGDTLFVFARAEQGPPMPLAVARMPVPQFPVTVQLDESMAMMPQMTLATFPRVYIGARISRSGNAQAAPGDLQGRSEGLAPASTDAVAVEITEVVGR